MKSEYLLTMFFVVFGGVLGACSQSPTEPGYEVTMMSDMKRPVPYEAYAQHPTLGMTLQSPVEGTVPRGSAVSIPESNPLKRTKKVLARGKHLYQTFCLTCHGVTGEGDGPLIPKYPNPPALSSRRLMAMTSTELYRVITEGKRDMPSHAGQIEEVDRWALIHYVESLQGKEGGVQ